ncbi:hypothetical protein [Helicobacter pylori]|uniref:hypothetical protein n=1 Tax=Helicobacter pylori TaxID=210 RepID=UPI0002BACDF0|nr:hypothetical protein [Helicobacter pylori]EMG97704.1 hypothetical protein HMPREF1402_01206 [Helicobacter pylori GAM121Aii]
MLLNYDFLEWVDDEPQRNTSLTASIDKALADRKLARQNKPRVRIKGGLSLRATLDAFGEELSRLKSEQNTTIKATRLGGIVNKIKSGLPFGTISAFRVFKPYFEAIFTDDQQALLKKAYSSGLRPNEKDKISKLYLAQMKENKTKFREATDDIDPTKSIKVKEFFIPTGKVIPQYKILVKGIYEALSRKLGKNYVDEFINSNATMRDFMSSEKLVKKYRFTQKDNIKRTQELKSLLDQKRHFLGYLQVTGYWKESLKDDLLPDKETSFFVFANEPSSTFDLKDHLQVWGAEFNQAAICYGGQMLANKNKTYRIDLISTSPGSYDKVWAKFTGIKFSVPSDLPQALTRINDSVYTFLSKYKGGLGINKIVKTELKATCMPYDYSKLGIGTIGEEIRDNIKALQKITRGYGHPKEFFLDAMIERQKEAIKRIEARKCAVSDDYRQGMRRNIQVSKIAKAMRQGKKVSKTLIAKVLANTIDTDAGYCFISPTDLTTQLGNISPRLSKSIVTAIEQAEGIRLLYALIDKVTYNSLHNTLNFIFDIDNPMSDQSLNELVVEVPREALKNVKLPQIKNVLTSQIFDGAYQFRGNDYQFKG